MKYLEAPNRINFHEIKDWDKTVFLAGSITGSSQWQNIAKDKLLPHFNVFNPRRENFDMSDVTQERLQIHWEFEHLDAASIILFYFDCFTLSPISLFEFGKMLALSRYTPWKKVYPCIHPDYKRKNDVIIQTELENIEFAKKIRFDLGETCDMIIAENE